MECTNERNAKAYGQRAATALWRSAYQYLSENDDSYNNNDNNNENETTSRRRCVQLSNGPRNQQLSPVRLSRQHPRLTSTSTSPSPSLVTFTLTPLTRRQIVNKAAAAFTPWKKTKAKKHKTKQKWKKTREKKNWEKFQFLGKGVGTRAGLAVALRPKMVIQPEAVLY